MGDGFNVDAEKLEPEGMADAKQEDDKIADPDGNTWLVQEVPSRKSSD